MDFIGMSKSIEEIVTSSQGTWGVVIEHLESGKRFTINPDHLFYAASIIKMPIMSAVYREQLAARLNLHDTLTLHAQDQVGGSGVLQLLTPGTTLTIKDLVTLMIAVSDNAATNMLIDRLTLPVIQASLEEDGMTASALRNKLQTVPAVFNGRNEITAQDIATWCRKVAKGELVSLYASLQMVDVLKRQQYRNKLPALLPDPENPIAGGLPLWEMANKTGMVKDIEHDAGILYLPGASFVIVTLSYQCSDAIPTMQRIGRTIYDHWLASR